MPVLWFAPKAAAALLILLFFASLPGFLKRRPYLLFLPVTVAVLVARDLVYLVFPQYQVALAGDIAVVFGYLAWLRAYTGPRRSDWIIVAVVAALFGVAVVNSLAGPFLPRFVLAGLPLVVPLVYLGGQAYAVTPFNTTGAEAMYPLRALVLTGLVIGSAAPIVASYDSIVTHVLIYPLYYFFHGYVLGRINRRWAYERVLAAEEAETQRESLFAFMRRLRSAIADRLDLEHILQLAADSAVENTRAEGAAVFLVNDEGTSLRVRALGGFYPPPFQVPQMATTRPQALRDYFFGTDIPVDASVLGECLTSVSPIFVRNAYDDPRFASNRDSELLSIGSFVALPLIVGDRVLGVLSMIRRRRGDLFTEAEFDHMKTFADYAGLAIDILFTSLELLEKQEIEREIGIAADIQRKLAPTSFPRALNGSVSVISRPARGVGGDYYDVFPLGDTKVGFVVCDVAGKGVPASLVMVMIRSLLRLIASPKRDAATTLTWVNRGLTGQIDLDHYATMSILFYDTKARTLEYANAAHHPLIIFHPKTGSYELLDTEGLPVGIEASARYQSKTASVSPDDVLILYTDGIVEAMSPAGEQYSFERFAGVLRREAGADPAGLAQAVQADMEDFVGNAKQHDDQTLVVLQVR